MPSLSRAAGALICFPSLQNGKLLSCRDVNGCDDVHQVPGSALRIEYCLMHALPMVHQFLLLCSLALTRLVETKRFAQRRVMRNAV